MNEGRRTQVVLLDGRRLDIVVQPRLHTTELLNIVASHCQLKPPDKQYFGLAYIDCLDQYHWLQIDRDRRVLDHEFPRKYTSPGSTLVIYHLVRFTVRVSQLEHPSTVELFFLHAKQQLLKGNLLFPDVVSLHSAFAHLLQVLNGDHGGVQISIGLLRKLCQHSANQGFLKCHRIADEEFEALVVSKYSDLQGFTLGASMIGFVSLIEVSATYGMNWYQVFEKSGTKTLLGINASGIMQFDPENIYQPKKQFRWKQLENLYYRDKKFSLEVRGSKRVEQSLSAMNTYEDVSRDSDHFDDLHAAVADPSSIVSVSRRTLVASPIQVYAFFCATPQLCKAIWSFAVAQHTFYLDSGIHRMMDVARSSSTQPSSHAHHSQSVSMAERLTRSLESGSSLQNFDGIQPPKEHSISRTTVSSGTTTDSGFVSNPSLSTNTSQKSLTNRQQDIEKYRELKARRQQINDVLVHKLAALKALCVEEGNITGKLPVDIHKALAPGEPLPKVQRRVGTTFAIPADLLSDKSTKLDQIKALETDVEVQRRIVSAAHRLATDKSTNKSVRKKRTRDYEAAVKRLAQVEQKLHYLRHRGSQPDLVSHSLSSTFTSQDRPPSASRLRASSLKQSLNQLVGRSSSTSRNQPPNHNRAYPDFAGFPVAVVRAPGDMAFTPQSAPVTPHGSTPDLSSAVGTDNDSNADDHYVYNGPMQHDLVQSTHSAHQQDTLLLNALHQMRITRHRKTSNASDSGSTSLQPAVSSPNTSHRRLSPSSASSPSLPLYENVGYKPPSRGMYQSSYRLRQYPTLPKSTAGSPRSARQAQAPTYTVSMSHQHRTHSQNSLQSLSSAQLEGMVQPLPDYRTAGGSSIEHECGAYNLPRQRTSWKYDSHEQGLNNQTNDSCVPPTSMHDSTPTSSSMLSLPQPNAALSSQSPLSTTKLSNGTPSITGSPLGYSGSLDRKLIKARQRMRMQHHQQQHMSPNQQQQQLSPNQQQQQQQFSPNQQQQHASPVQAAIVGAPLVMPPANIFSNSSSPIRAGGSRVAPSCASSSPSSSVNSGCLAVNVHCEGIEMMKPFETSDAMKYSAMRLRSPLNSSFSGTRPPPPPYRGSPTQHHSFASPDRSHHLPPTPSNKSSPVKKATVV